MAFRLKATGGEGAGGVSRYIKGAEANTLGALKYGGAGSGDEGLEGKMWLTDQDERVRMARGGTAGNVVNCTCTTIPVLEV